MSFEQFYKDYFGMGGDTVTPDHCTAPLNRESQAVTVGDLRAFWNKAQETERQKDQ